MKRFSVILFTLLLSMGMWAKSERRTVIFDVEIHCQNCINKIEKNIAFEPGVKDLICNLDDKTVTVVFDPAKTSVEQLQAAFAKINKPAKIHTESANEDVDAHTGASTPQ